MDLLFIVLFPQLQNGCPKIPGSTWPYLLSPIEFLQKAAFYLVSMYASVQRKRNIFHENVSTYFHVRDPHLNHLYVCMSFHFSEKQVSTNKINIAGYTCNIRITFSKSNLSLDILAVSNRQNCKARKEGAYDDWYSLSKFGGTFSLPYRGFTCRVK